MIKSLPKRLANLASVSSARALDVVAPVAVPG